MKSFREAEREGWSARAGGYADVTAVSTLQFVPMLLHAAGIRPGLRLLDLCCGPGFAGAAAAALGLEVRAEDFSAEMVAEATRRFGGLPGLDIGLGDAERLDHPDGAFDVVICNFGIIHLAEPEAAFAEAFRVLRPGGRYAFSQWEAPERSALQGMVLGAIRAHADLSRLPPAPDAFRYSEPEQAEAALRAAGFEAVGTARVEAVMPAPAGDFMAHFHRYAVRAPMAVGLQDADVQARIAAEVNAAARAFARKGGREGGQGESRGEGPDVGLMIPNPGLVYSARRPG